MEYHEGHHEQVRKWGTSVSLPITERPSIFDERLVIEAPKRPPATFTELQEFLARNWSLPAWSQVARRKFFLTKKNPSKPV